MHIGDAHVPCVVTVIRCQLCARHRRELFFREERLLRGVQGHPSVGSSAGEVLLTYKIGSAFIMFMKDEINLRARYGFIFQVFPSQRSVG